VGIKGRLDDNASVPSYNRTALSTLAASSGEVGLM
jgi:hypothetical protein